jgi:hypothetical protein
MSSFRKLVPLEQEGKGRNEQKGGGDRTHTITRLKSLLLIILKIARINGYDDETRIRGSDGNFIENSNLITLLDYVTSGGKRLVGEEEFFELMKKANVPPELILNENARLKLISLYNQPVAKKINHDNDENRKAKVDIDELMDTENMSEIKTTKEVPKVDSEQQTVIRKFRDRPMQTIKRKGKSQHTQWEDPDAEVRQEKRRRTDDDDYDSDATEIYYYPEEPSQSTEDVKRIKDRNELKSKDIIDNQPAIYLDRIPDIEQKRKWVDVIDNQPRIYIDTDADIERKKKLLKLK